MRSTAIPAEQFHRRWAGFATAKVPYTMKRGQGGTYWQFVERSGERPQDWQFRGFVCTGDRDEVAALTEDYPRRWHLEEFFNFNQALGWQRAGTMNVNIRYGQMTMALIAQTVVHQLRTRLGEPYSHWDANHLARDLFLTLEGDVRVQGKTIVVTYYNAPNADQLRRHYDACPTNCNRITSAPISPGYTAINSTSGSASPKTSQINHPCKIAGKASGIPAGGNWPARDRQGGNGERGAARIGWHWLCQCDGPVDVPSPCG